MDEKCRMVDFAHTRKHHTHSAELSVQQETFVCFLFSEAKQPPLGMVPFAKRIRKKKEKKMKLI